MLKIFYRPNFVRSYKKLPTSLQQEIKEKIELFTVNPNHLFLKTHKLKGKLKGLFSFSVNYQYRIVFLYKSEKEVSLLAVGDHDIYK